VFDDWFCIEVVLQFFEGIAVDGRPALAVRAALVLNRKAHYVEEEVLKLLVGRVGILAVFSDLEVEPDPVADYGIELFREAVDILAVREENFVAPVLVHEDAARVHLKQWPL
jgi:hypothetical protein